MLDQNGPQLRSEMRGRAIAAQVVFIPDPAKIPDWWWTTHPDWACTRPDPFHMRCHYQLINDNVLDVTHLAYVHATSIGSGAITEFPVTCEREGRVVRMKRWIIDRAEQPAGVRTVAMMFKDPHGATAEALVSQSGARDIRVGEAAIHSPRANFVVAHPGCTAEDVRLLVPYGEGRVLSDLYALGAPIDEREDTPEGVAACSSSALRPPARN